MCLEVDRRQADSGQANSSLDPIPIPPLSFEGARIQRETITKQRMTAEGVFRAREVRRIELQNTWDKEAIDNVIEVSWRIADGKWTVDTPATQFDLVFCHHHQCR